MVVLSLRPSKWVKIWSEPINRSLWASARGVTLQKCLNKRMTQALSTIKTKWLRWGRELASTHRRVRTKQRLALHTNSMTNLWLARVCSTGLDEVRRATWATMVRICACSKSVSELSSSRQKTEACSSVAALKNRNLVVSQVPAFIIQLSHSRSKGKWRTICHDVVQWGLATIWVKQVATTLLQSLREVTLESTQLCIEWLRPRSCLIKSDAQISAKNPSWILVNLKTNWKS